MTRLLLICCGLLVASIAALGASSVESPSGSLLERRFPDPKISFLLLDAHTRETIASRWADVDQPVPLGSLVKPFAALAYGAGHTFRYPTFHCFRASGCWYPPGHGSMNLSQALAHSCNHYFRQLSAAVAAEDLANVTARFGLPAPPQVSGTDAYWGLGADWRIDPAALLRAYIALSRQPAVPGSEPVLRGLALSARQGTAQGVGTAVRQAPPWRRPVRGRARIARMPAATVLWSFCTQPISRATRCLCGRMAKPAGARPRSAARCYGC